MIFCQSPLLSIKNSIRLQDNFCRAIHVYLFPALIPVTYYFFLGDAFVDYRGLKDDLRIFSNEKVAHVP